MSHEILGERFLGRSKPAWHGIGTIFSADTVISSSEAVQRVAGDIRVEALPVAFQIPESWELEENGLTRGWNTMEKHRAIVMAPTEDQPHAEFFGLTSDNWEALSYVDLAKGLDELSRTYKVETAGVLKGGSICFISLRGDRWEVKGDEITSYFVGNLSLKPGKAHAILHTPVRTVCWNTLTMAEERASINLAIAHNGDAARMIALAGDLIARFKECQERSKEAFDRFAEVNVTDEQVREVIEAAYPEPSMPKKLQLIHGNLTDEQATLFRGTLTPEALTDIVNLEEQYQSARERIERIRATTFERFEAFECADESCHGTVWAAYNACTEVSDWRQGRYADESTVWGSRAKEKSRAFLKCMEICGMTDDAADDESSNE
jgi:hypothetical protein